MLYYENAYSEEITTNHKEAVEWFRHGFNINLRKVDPNTGALEIIEKWEW